MNEIKKPRVLVTYVEAGLGHIVTAEAISDSLKAKYGDKLEIIDSHILRDSENKILNDFEQWMVKEVSRHSKIRGYCAFEMACMHIIGSKNTLKLIHNTRFGKASDLVREVEEITGNRVVHTIVDAEPLGPKISLDALIISPCTGNTLAKIARGITDTSVTMAAKAHLRSDRPTVLALCSNDALSANLQNISILLERKNVFFVPMKQDDPSGKPHSLVCEFSLLNQTFKGALERRQIQPLFL